MTNPPERARAWVDIDLGALVANARVVAARCGSRLLPMVKANGYGLGAVEVARALAPLEPWGFGVATPDEAGVLRAAGIHLPIVVFTPLTADTIESTLQVGARASIGDLDMLAAWTARSSAPFHLEIDTGMARAGLRSDDADAIGAVGALLRGAPGWEGVFTHFHSAGTDSAATATQWVRFQEVIAALPRRPAIVHAANSAGALAGARYAADLVRPGIFLYGGAAAGTVAAPVAALRTRVMARRRIDAGATVSYGATWAAIAPTTIATLGIGYADGVHRALGGRGMVELGGRRVPIVGRVTMDMTMIAAPADVQIGDVASVYGEDISIDAQATAAGTIAYELLTSLGSRLPRLYQGSG